MSALDGDQDCDLAFAFGAANIVRSSAESEGVGVTIDRPVNRLDLGPRRGYVTADLAVWHGKDSKEQPRDSAFPESRKVKMSFVMQDIEPPQRIEKSLRRVAMGVDDDRPAVKFFRPALE